MNPRFVSLRKRIIAISLGFVLILEIVSIISLISLIGQPFPGFLMFYHDGIDAYFVNTDPPWWPGVVSGEFENAQHIVQLEGVVGIDWLEDLIEIYNREAQQDGYLDLITDSWGTKRTHRVPLIPFSWHHFFDVKNYDFIVGLGFWLLAFSLYRVYRDDEVIFIVILSSLSLVLPRWGNVLVGLFPIQFIPRAFHIIYVLFGGTLAGALIAHLSLLFPTRTRLHRPWLVALLYLVAMVTSLAAVGAIILEATPYRSLENILREIGFRSIYYYGLVGVVAIMTRMVYEAILSRNKRVQIIARIILIGFAVGLLYWIPFTLHKLSIISFDPLTAWIDMRYLFLLFPSVAGFVTLRYRAFQEVNLLFMLVPALAVSGLLASLATNLLQHVTGFPQAVKSTAFMIIFLFVFGTAVLFLFQSTWRGSFGRILQWDKYHLTGLQRLGHSLSQQASPEQMAHTIVHSLVQEMALRHTAVWLPTPLPNQYNLQATAGENITLPHQLILPDSEKEQFLNGRPHYIRDIAPRQWATDLTHLNANEILLPISLNQQLLALLYLGARWDEDIFDSRDLIIIELLGQQLGQFMLTAQHMAELQAIPRTIAVAQEEERFRLAQELHDTTQQLLGRLPLFLETSRAYIPTNQAEAERLLRLCIQDVAREARNVRAIRNSLAPTRLATGLAQPLQALVDRYRLRFGLSIELKLLPDLDAHTSEGTRHAIYRVVQQALDNVVEHAHAQQVWVHFSEENGRLQFQIKDNGQGFNPTQNSMGFGLHSMKARIEMFGGQLTVTSHNPQGTLIRGWLPLP